MVDAFDTDRSAGIDAAEMRTGMQKIGISLTSEQAETLLAEADADDDGHVDREEFEFVVMNQIRAFEEDSKPLCCVIT